MIPITSLLILASISRLWFQISDFKKILNVSCAFASVTCN
jgi:hypothetical protein